MKSILLIVWLTALNTVPVMADITIKAATRDSSAVVTAGGPVLLDVMLRNSGNGQESISMR